MNAKDLLVAELAERTGISYHDANNFIGQWAASSNDDDMRSLMIQRDAAEVFGIPLSEFTKGKIAMLEERLSAFNISNPDVLRYVQDNRPELLSLLPSGKQQSLFRAMNEYTQEQLTAAGYGPGSTIRLRRGVRLPLDMARDWNVDDLVPIEGNAIESWSLGKDVAERFTHGRTYYTERGVIFEMDVPVEMIVGSSRTGFGCLMEGEFIVKGLPSNARIAWLGDFKVD